MHDAKYAFSLDIRSRNWKVEVDHRGSERKPRFETRTGLINFRPCSLDYVTLPLHFYVRLKTLLESWNYRQRHSDHLSHVLESVSQAQLVLIFEKCRTGSSELPLLGFLFNAQGICAGPRKTSAFVDFRPLRVVKHLQSLERRQFLTLEVPDKCVCMHRVRE